MNDWEKSYLPKLGYQLNQNRGYPDLVWQTNGHNYDNEWLRKKSGLKLGISNQYRDYSVME